ncbi:MAG TPA: SIMPL domain-containing protein [Candidatus Limnocylindria bacterium]|jgi:uncharacterized protein YggE|nr:SIMPL domain-containing protein [Candidatus Limnocylindria bacterium]
MKTVLCILFAFSTAALADRPFMPTSNPSRVISVTGTAEVRVKPDIIHINTGIETRDTELDAAKNENDRRMAAVLQFLKNQAIAKNDIQTDRINLMPVYRNEYQQNATKPIYFDVDRRLAVCLHSSTNFDELVTGLVKAGVTHIQDIEFHTTELRKHRDAARQLAIRAAKEKAVALAQELGAKVGPPQSINENTWGGSYAYSGMNNRQMMSQNSVAYGGNQGSGESAEGPDGSLALGVINIGATVNVTFELQ